MKRFVLYVLVSAFLLSFAVSSRAVTFDGVNVPEHMKVDNQTINLNGYGIRYFKLLFIKVKVYLGSLYSDLNHINTVNDLVNDNGPKVIVMHFLHSAKAKQIRDTFVKDFTHNFKQILGMDVEKDFLNLFTKDVKPGDEVKLVLHKNGDVCVFYNDVKSGCVKSSPILQKAVLMAYFGPHPYSEDLKKQMFGLEKAE